jgi:hypothetical protein
MQRQGQLRRGDEGTENVALESTRTIEIERLPVIQTITR